MRPLVWLIVTVILVALAAVGGFLAGGRGSDEPGESSATQPAGEETKAVADVSTAAARIGPISQTLRAYGAVVAQPGDVRVLSVPFESRIIKALVTPGQQVDAGTAVLRLEASPDALIAMQEAKNALAAAERDLAQTQRRFNDHLATNAELSAAQVALDSAKLKLTSMSQRGVGSEQMLKSDAVGIVSKLNVQEGQIVAAGAPLVEIASGKQVEVALGIEPGDATSLKPGQAVELRVVGGSSSASSPPLAGQVRVITRRVDPATRLASALVSLPPDAALMLETFVEGRIIKTSTDALLVPRNAILPQEEGGYALFTVKDSHAVKHKVEIGLENDRDVQIVSGDVKEGDVVAVTGSYELEDGMEVKPQPIASTQPATREAAP